MFVPPSRPAICPRNAAFPRRGGCGIVPGVRSGIGSGTPAELMDHTLVPSGAAIPPSRLSPTVADVRDQLERLLSSASLRLSTRRRDLLCFLVEETLEGRADRLKGFTVATAVFGRDGSFDPSSDPVVRLEARRLRSDLDSYYVDAGSHDPVRITIPKGGYVPHFEWQGRASPPEEHSPPPEGPAVNGPAPPSVQAGEGRRGRALWAALVVAALLVAAGAWATWDRLVPVEEAHGPSLIVLPFAVLSDGRGRPPAGCRDDPGGDRPADALSRRPAVLDARRASRRTPRPTRASSAGGWAPPTWCRGASGPRTYLVHVRVMLTDAETGEVLLERDLRPAAVTRRHLHRAGGDCLGNLDGAGPALRRADRQRDRRGRRRRACRATAACCRPRTTGGPSTRASSARRWPASRRRWCAIPTMPTPGRCSVGCTSTPGGSTSCRTATGPTGWRWRAPPAPTPSTRTTCWR